MSDIADTGTALVLSSALVPAVVFAEGGVDSVLDQIKRQVAGVEIDISTATGRRECASLAYKIARSKTALDDMGKTLGEDWRKKVDAINADRRRIRSELDTLADQVRQPLTDWENADKARLAAHEAAIKEIEDLGSFAVPIESEIIKSRLDRLGEADDRDWQEFAKRAADAKAAAFGRLTQAHAVAVKRETEAAEAERLRVEEEARIKREREAAIAAAAAENAKREAEAKAAAEAETERQRVEAERAAAEQKAVEERAEIERRAAAERDQIERKAKEAAAVAAAEQKRLADEKAEAERRALQAEADRLAAEAKAKADAEEAERQRIAAAAEVERARKAAAEQAERERMAAIETERKRQVAEKEAEAAEAKRREADKRHRGQVNSAAVDALVAYAHLTDEQARAVVTAIARHEIPRVAISY